MRRGLTPASGRGSALGGGRRELVRTEPRVCLPHIPGSKARLSIQEFFCTMQCAPADLSTAQSRLACSTVSKGPI